MMDSGRSVASSPRRILVVYASTHKPSSHGTKLYQDNAPANETVPIAPRRTVNLCRDAIHFAFELARFERPLIH